MVVIMSYSYFKTQLLSRIVISFPNSMTCIRSGTNDNMANHLYFDERLTKIVLPRDILVYLTRVPIDTQH